MKSFALWLLSLLSLISCAALNAPVRHARDLSAYQSFSVVALPNDALGLTSLIDQNLKKEGLNSRVGDTQTANTARVRYRYETLPEDSHHLMKLVLEVVDSQSGKAVTVSVSTQVPSLMPDSNADMVAKALRNLLAATPGPKGHPRGSLMERETLLW